MNLIEITSCINDLKITNNDANNIINLLNKKNYDKVKKILLSKRNEKLKLLHDNQDDLYCFDYLIKRLEK